MAGGVGEQPVAGRLGPEGRRLLPACSGSSLAAGGPDVVVPAEPTHEEVEHGACEDLGAVHGMRLAACQLKSSAGAGSDSTGSTTRARTWEWAGSSLWPTIEPRADQLPGSGELPQAWMLDLRSWPASRGSERALATAPRQRPRWREMPRAPRHQPPVRADRRIWRIYHAFEAADALPLEPPEMPPSSRRGVPAPAHGPA